MIILGVDPALTVSGYGAIEIRGGFISLLEAGVLKTSAGEQISRRLDKIYRGMLKLITDIKPEVMVLEKLYAHYRHPTTAFILGQARGVICLACATKNIPLVEYSATRVKKSVVGEGLASKDQVQKVVAKILDLDITPKYTDVSDALALAIAHSNMIKARI
jgi:crossover junction endodeoxyribonuclease RuvC